MLSASLNKTFPSFRLTSKQFKTIYGSNRKEGNILFKDALNTFYLWLYGVGHMVKDHAESKRGNLVPPYGLIFPISSKGSFICTISVKIGHSKAFVAPVADH